MFTKVLIANRGAIACRVIRTLRRLGVRSAAVYSDADAQSLHVRLADEAVGIGPAPAAQSYLDMGRIIAAAQSCGAQAIHPGYGFLSENPDFADACGAAGLVFVGPTGAQMRMFGAKHSARAAAEASGVPLLPGTGLLRDPSHARSEAGRIGYPVMLKSTAGGGGIGISLVRGEDEISAAFPSVERLARSHFRNGGVFLEKYVEKARHIEVQIFGDGRGNVVALGERDCSVQRRNQKMVEETPAPGIPDARRADLLECASRLGRAAGYRSAGTVEFIYDEARGAFHFLEVNTRLQVEHGVTEEATGVDLVEWMLLAASGELDLSQWRPRPRGAAIQVRVYAEDPGRGFQPCAGTLTDVHLPRSVRVETWVERGTDVSIFYDPLLAKLIAHGRDRNEALARLGNALDECRIHGLETNLEYLRQIVASPGFRRGGVTTGFLALVPYEAATVEVIEPGTQSTIQDHPGRLGYWDVGVPPSGPMDGRSFRLANRIVGNIESAAGLEFTVNGPALRFNCPSVVALTGASMSATLDGRRVPYYRAVDVKRGQVLKLGAIAGPGMRTYLAVRNGFDVPDYLGSKSTFTLGRFGGHAGRALRAGDVLHLHRDRPGAAPPCAPEYRRIRREIIPSLHREWDVAVLYGPHGAPDFFTDDDVAELFSSPYEVHYNSARTGVRLIGPRPRWARRDGGEAGLHPSNIHDNAYAVGAIDFTGDMPIILGPDGPSCGGFVCPAVIVEADTWKAGQLRPGDTVRFRPVTFEAARLSAAAQDLEIATLKPVPCAADTARRPGAIACPEAGVPVGRSGANGDRAPGRGAVLTRGAAPSKTARSGHPAIPGRPVLRSVQERAGGPAVCYRQSGDAYLLVEYGPLVLDIALRMRVHALQTWLERRRVHGIIDLTPGIRSLQVHFDRRSVPPERLLETLQRAEEELPGVDDMEVPSRIVHLPLSWEDDSTLLAIRKYMQIVRKDAPWCPSNIEFIRRINGLDSAEEVRRTAFDASYLVLALGDVYLGAPVATPVDPRHRLVTTKYNPARTWTPENAVGIGGAYLCIYGMEGPGGYQFIGRTCQMWNRYRQTADFAEGKPWLLRFFDQIRFHPVSNAELTRFREEFPLGRARLKIEETTFNLRGYHAFLAENAASIADFKARQQAAFEAERRRWEESGLLNYSSESESVATVEEPGIPAGCTGVPANMPGNIWKIAVEPGASVAAGDPLVILESMKMEITVVSNRAGRVREVRCAEGRPVNAGETLVVIE